MTDVKTKQPSTTTTIVAGWTNPTNAYVEDGLCTYSSTDDAEQEYGGWNWTTNDIPAGSTITKVEFGAKHYETTDWYTVLKVINSSNLSLSWSLTQRSTLTWDWVDVTIAESTWDLNKLNNDKWRIISSYVPPEGCVHPDSAILMEDGSLKPAKEIRVGDRVVSLIRPDGTKEIGEVIKVTHHFSKKPFKLIGLFESSGRDVAFAPQHTIRAFIDKEWKSIRVDELIKHPLPFTIAGATDDGSRFQPRLINEFKIIETNHTVNIEVDKGHFYCSYVHVHNLAKKTCYVDKLAVRVTYTPPAVGALRIQGESITKTITFG